MRKYSGLGYMGGKSYRNSTGIGSWIANLLPVGRYYCEPFAGMLGVLLQRPRVATEIASDANGRVINWWRTIRDQPDEFGDRLDWTSQRHQAEYEWAGDHLDDPDPVTAALAFTLAVTNSIRNTDAWNKSNYTLMGSGGKRHWMTADVLAVRDRINKVQFVTMDACEIVEKIALKNDHQNRVTYLDPPYTTATSSGHYQKHTFDRERLTAGLLTLKGPTAISGYNDEWDHLGWWRNERPVTVLAQSRPGEQKVGKRVEVLWTNYQPEPVLDA